jgi:hypothetical protein
LAAPIIRRVDQRRVRAHRSNVADPRQHKRLRAEVGERVCDGVLEPAGAVAELALGLAAIGGETRR